MWYERVGMGFVEMSGGCSDVSGGRRICVSAEETPPSGCRVVSGADVECELPGEGYTFGTTYCCPPAAVAGAPGAAPAAAKQPAADWASQMLYPAELVGQKATEAVEAIGNLASNVASNVAGVVGGVVGDVTGKGGATATTRPATAETTTTETASVVAVGTSRWLPWVLGGTVIVGGIALIAWLAGRDRYARSRSATSNPYALELRRLSSPSTIHTYSVKAAGGFLGTVLKVGRRWLPSMATGPGRMLHLHRGFTTKEKAAQYLQDVWEGKEAPV